MSLFLGFFKHENRKGLWEPPRLIDCLRVWGSVYIKKGRQRGRSRAEIAYCTQSALRYCGRESQILEPRKRSEAYNDTCRDLALFPQMWEAQFSPLQNSHELVLLGCTFLLQETEEKRPRQTMQRKREEEKVPWGERRNDGKGKSKQSVDDYARSGEVEGGGKPKVVHLFPPFPSLHQHWGKRKREITQSGKGFFFFSFSVLFSALVPWGKKRRKGLF